MTLRVGIGPLSLIACVFAAPAQACLFPPPPVKLAGESDEDWRKRTTAALEAELQANLKLGEANDYREASTIYLGRIVSSEEISTDGSKYGRRVVVRALAALKGKLPTESKVLQTRTLTSCGFEGGGRAVWGSVGSLAIIFDGLPPYGFKNETTDSVLAKDVQHEPLVAAVRTWIAERPLYEADRPK